MGEALRVVLMGRQKGMFGFANPSAVAGIAAVDGATARDLVQYLLAKQELGEMKRELAQLRDSVNQLEAMLEQNGPVACGASAANRAFVNWMVSFAESYYGLAQALGAKEAMLPRVMAFLGGKHQNPALAGLDQALASKGGTPSYGEKMVKDLLARAFQQVPAFMRR
jgi:cobalamin biosynthesis Mg chelatase CobN